MALRLLYAPADGGGDEMNATTKPTTDQRCSMRATILVTVAAAVLSVSTAAAGPRTDEALSLCNRADGLTGEARAAMLDRALAAAESAVDANDGDANAHFAVFCALGKQMRDAGVSLTALPKLRRAQAAVDRALEIDPNNVQALIGKGAALMETPAIAGGDEEEGRDLLRRALELDPENMAAHLYLARGGSRPLAMAQRAD
jgi:tetratricopeptide (TPR) repeat protein